MHIKTACQNQLTLEKVTEALRRQHPNIHVGESKRHGKDDLPTNKVGFKHVFHKPKPFRKGPMRRPIAYMHMTEDDHEELEAYMAADDSSDCEEVEMCGYTCVTSASSPDEFVDVEDQIEQDVVAAFVATEAKK